jgi:hypothetical protein
VAEPGGAAALLLPPEAPHRRLVQPLHEAPHLHPPGLHAVAGKAELAEGDAQLRRPPQRVDARLGHVHRVPRGVRVRRGLPRVALHPRWVDEDGRAPRVVVVGVEDELDVVAAAELVAPRELGAHPGAAQRVEHPRADVQRLRVVEDADLGALGGGLALARVLLPEVGGNGCRRPRRLVQPPVHHDGRGALHRLQGRRLARGVRAVLRRRGHGERQEEHGGYQGSVSKVMGTGREGGGRVRRTVEHPLDAAGARKVCSDVPRPVACPRCPRGVACTVHPRFPPPAPGSPCPRSATRSPSRSPPCP